MDHHGLTAMLKEISRLLCLVLLFISAACSAEREQLKGEGRLLSEKTIRASEWEPAVKAAPAAPQPDFIPVGEDVVPVKTRMVNISVRNAALGDVLHVVADASGLNLLIDRDVQLDQPVTLSLRNVSAQDALSTIFQTVDCFYTINNNILKIEAMGTRVFELGHPALVNTYSVDVGGDILGGAMVSASGGGGSGSGNLKGTITSGSKGDTKAYDFWEGLEKSLDNLVIRKEVTTRVVKSSDSRSDSRTGTGNGTRASGTGSDKKDSETTIIERPITASGGGSEQQPSITVNRLTGTIMVTASKKTLEKVERYIETVKKILGRQVMIEARIIEVQLSDELKYGIDWSFLENIKALGGPLNAGFGALNMATRGFTPVSDAAVPQFQVGLARANFQALLTALKTQGDVKTISNPKINVMNGHASILTVGRNTSYIAKVTSTTTAASGSTPITTFNVETNSVLSGMIIGIVPYISEGGEISLNITPITSDLVTLKEKSIGAAGSGTMISIPTVDLREMTTTVKMRDGQMAIIGGLISKKGSVNEEKVPLVGDIPYLGKLFTRVNNTESRSELVLLLKPHIVSND